MELYNQPVQSEARGPRARGAGLKYASLWLQMLALLASACSAGDRGLPPAAVGSRASDTGPTPATAAATLPVPSPTEQLESADWLHPYTLEGLRERTFESVPLKGREETLKTSIFTRYAITYESDGLLITGTMQIPAEGEPPYPVIVMNHGFFNRTEYRSGDGTDRAAEYLNRHGYLTLSSDYRSWGGSEAGPSLYYSGLVIDVVNLMMAADDIPEADASRIGMWGHSMGGGVTMKVLMLDTPVRAAVLYSTVSADDADMLARWGLGCIGDIEAGENQTDCNSSDVVPLDLPPELIRAYYDASVDPELLRRIAPIHNLSLLLVPVQIHFGTEDGRNMVGTPPEWSRKLFEALELAGKPVEIFAYEAAKHSFVGDSWVAFMERSAHFFDEYVKAGESQPDQAPPSATP
jgi:dipeptidyl aminopeptidase/acylaminoacyl peptidase